MGDNRINHIIFYTFCAQDYISEHWKLGIKALNARAQIFHYLEDIVELFYHLIINLFG